MHNECLTADNIYMASDRIKDVNNRCVKQHCFIPCKRGYPVHGADDNRVSVLTFMLEIVLSEKIWQVTD